MSQTSSEGKPIKNKSINRRYSSRLVQPSATPFIAKWVATRSGNSPTLVAKKRWQPREMWQTILIDSYSSFWPIRWHGLRNGDARGSPIDSTNGSGVQSHCPPAHEEHRKNPTAVATGAGRPGAAPPPEGFSPGDLVPRPPPGKRPNPDKGPAEADGVSEVAPVIAALL